MSEPSTRRYRGGDAAEVTAIFLAARARMGYLPRPHTDAQTRAWITGHVLTETEVWIAERDGAVAGFASLHGSWLDHLYVDPNYQREGVGSVLLRRAKQERPQGLRLHVFTRNEGARRFYRDRGFAVESERDGAHNEEGLPDLVMHWPGTGS